MLPQRLFSHDTESPMASPAAKVDEEAISLLTNVPTEKFSDDKLQQGTGTAWRQSLPVCAKRLFFTLLPSFISSRLGRRNGYSSSKEKLRPTAYLDGLRGLAAWAVFNAHLCTVVYKDGGAGWGHAGIHYELFRLPILRLIYNGNYAVAVFFVLSGVALSISFVNSLRQTPRDPAVAFQRLASSIFRRPFRLLLPSWASMVLAFVLVRLHYFSSLQARQAEFEQFVLGWPVLYRWPPFYPSFWQQVVDLVCVCGDMLKIMTDPTDRSFALPYNSVLWTLKLEFRASLILFLTHAALYFCSRRNRILITATLIFITVSVSSFDIPHFLAGYLIAETIDFSPTLQHQPIASRRARSAGAILAILFGTYLGSFAEFEAVNTPIYSWLIPLTPFNFIPGDRFWSGLGAAMTIASLPSLPWLVRVLNSGLVQYFGKISFALYLVHFWIVQGFGTWMYYRIWSFTGEDNFTVVVATFFAGYAVMFAMTVWVADLFWRFVDVPLTNLGSRLQKHMFKEQ